MTSKQITFHFNLKDEDGTLIDTSYRSNQPVRFTSGKKELKPVKLEDQILELESGDKKTIVFSPEDAFGHRDEQKLVVVPISDIRLSYEGQNIERGQKVLLNLPENADTEDQEIFFTITSIMNGMVALDGNHPLAGRELTYEIEVIDKE